MAGHCIGSDSPEPLEAQATSAPGAGGLPYRVALAGGWIDQPFISRLDTEPPGAMVVASLVPEFRFMEYCGMATSTRRVAARLWGATLPGRDPENLMRELYQAENAGKCDPSGSQDMAGIVYPGISRLDYDASVHGGVFPAKVESCLDPDIASWLQSVLHFVPVAQRPAGYSPLGIQRLDPEGVHALGQTGMLCYDAILARDITGLQTAFNECMRLWYSLLPQTFEHPTITVDLRGIMDWYRSRYGGASYSGCGGGYLMVATEETVPGSFDVRVRLS